MADHTDSTFYVTGGTLRQDAACYVEPQADKDLLDGLLKEKAFARGGGRLSYPQHEPGQPAAPSRMTP